MAKKRVTKKKAARKKPRPSSKPQVNIEKLVQSEVTRQIPKVETGLVITLPNTTEEKLAAICDLSHAVSNLSRAIASTNVDVTIDSCTFQNHKTAISVEA